MPGPLPGPLLSLPSRVSPSDELAVEILQIGIRRGLDEATFAIALADAIGHLCATLDLNEGRREFDRRLGAFTKRADETYKRSLLLKRRTVLRDVHGRPTA